MGKVVRDTVTNPFSEVRSFDLLCDEANDVANKEQLITFVKFVNPTTSAVEEWLRKPRRKIAKVPSKDVQQAVQLQDAGVQVDTQSEEIERVWRIAEALDQEVDFLEKELERAEALLKLPPEKADSISEWKNSASELSDQDDLY